ncbi:MAG TPA: SMC-Scp complex subunit ScpB [Planctomycetota bacterium]|nr:SMC-Scp complex subunit ScpB [Planctomycetota bacterium]
MTSRPDSGILAAMQDEGIEGAVASTEVASTEEAPPEVSVPEGDSQHREDVSPADLEREVAALLFASSDPVSPARLGSMLGGVPKDQLSAALAALGERLVASGLPWELREIAGGWQLFTSPDMAETVSVLNKARRDEKVSPAALETLAVVAYRQPVTKAEIEAIRGVQVGPILRALVDRGLVKVAGRSDDPGRALLYATTRQFLDVFGLASLADLPRDGELLKD